MLKKIFFEETEDELRVYQSSPTRLPDKSNSVVNSPLKFQSPQSKFHSNSIANNKESSPFFAVPMGKPSTFMNFENAMKKMNHTDLKERYKLLKKNPEFRLTIDEIGIKKDIGKLAETTNKQEKMKSKHHLEEKLKTFSANLSHLKSNNDGFHKSLDLVNGLIKGLDLKIQKIRELKEVSPKMLSSLAALEKSPINEKEEEIIFESY